MQRLHVSTRLKSQPPSKDCKYQSRGSLTKLIDWILLDPVDCEKHPGRRPFLQIIYYNKAPNALSYYTYIAI